MGVHIEAQTDNEFRQIKARELQQENLAKLDKMVPVVENLESIDLGTVENNTQEIKNVVLENLENQPNIDVVVEKINDIEEKVQTIKKNITEIKKKNTQISKELKEINKKLEG